MDEKTFGQWLFFHSPMLATVSDREGRLEHVSATLAKRLGFTVDELLGKRLATLLAPATRRRVVEDYRPILQRAGTLSNVHVAMLTRSGRKLDLVSDAIANANDEGTVESVLSIYTEIGQMAEVEERFRRLYRATPTMLHSFNANGELLEVSDKWLRTLGYKRQDVVGHNVKEFLSERTVKDLAEGRLPIFASLEDYTNVPREMLCSDGRVIEVWSSAAVERNEDGSISMVLVASKDMTERNKVLRQLEQALEENAKLREQLENERDYLREEVDVAMNYGRIVGSSTALKRLLQTVDAVARTPSSVLITGESGTGKELVAHAIHSRSARAESPLVKVNCASIPHELFESEFFGHVKGAFTGAHRDRLGRFELANGGTLFLDEVGEIPLELQAKLLRVLQEGQFERVGEDHTRSVDVRVIAATNRDLEGAVEAGLFREDLYYRLSVFPIAVPPLRERGEDVIQLATHFLAQIGHDFGRDLPPITETIAQQLRDYSWPGNIRELRNTLERAAILSRGDRLVFELPGAGADRVAAAPVAKVPGALEVLTDEQFRQLEKDNIYAALKAADWRVSGAQGAARLLGLKPSTLSSRMRTMGIEVPQVRRGRPALVSQTP